MNTIKLTPKKALAVLEICYHLGHPVYLQGVSGVGKTALVRQLAEKLKVTLYPSIILTGYEACDLRGLPKLDEETKRSVWYPPEFLPDSDSTVEGILFIDELPNAKPELQTPCYQLLQEKRIGGYSLPAKTWVVAAGNGEDDDANLFDIQGPLLKRLIVLEIVPDITSWVENALDNNVHAKVITYLNSKPENLDHTLQVIRNVDDQIKPNPRAWSTFVSDALYVTSDRTVLEPIIAGVVGTATCSDFFITLDDLDSLAPVTELVELAKEGKTEALRALMPMSLSGVFCLIYSLQSMVNSVEDAEVAFTILEVMISVRDTIPRIELQELAVELICNKVIRKVPNGSAGLQKSPKMRETYKAIEARKNIV